MRDYVVDASVAIKWFVVEQDSNRADELSLSDDRLFAPSLITTEIANALSRKASAGLMTSADAKRYLRSASTYLDGIFPVDDLIEPALQNACDLRHPIFDLIYLELAQRRDANFVTADRRFASKIAGTGLAKHLVLLSDWRAA